MRLRYRAWALLPLVLGTLLLAGCSPANEEGIVQGEKAPRKEGMPDFKSYAEVQQYQAKQAAESHPAGKGKGKATPKPAPKEESKAPTEPQKSG
jgi:hypothetical protein